MLAAPTLDPPRGHNPSPSTSSFRPTRPPPSPSRTAQGSQSRLASSTPYESYTRPRQASLSSREQMIPVVRQPLSSASIRALRQRNITHPSNFTGAVVIGRSGAESDSSELNRVSPQSTTLGSIKPASSLAGIRSRSRTAPVSIVPCFGSRRERAVLQRPSTAPEAKPTIIGSLIRQADDGVEQEHQIGGEAVTQQEQTRPKQATAIQIPPAPKTKSATSGPTSPFYTPSSSSPSSQRKTDDDVSSISQYSSASDPVATLPATPVSKPTRGVRFAGSSSEVDSPFLLDEDEPKSAWKADEPGRWRSIRRPTLSKKSHRDLKAPKDRRKRSVEDTRGELSDIAANVKESTFSLGGILSMAQSKAGNPSPPPPFIDFPSSLSPEDALSPESPIPAPGARQVGHLRAQEIAPDRPRGLRRLFNTRKPDDAPAAKAPLFPSNPAPTFPPSPLHTPKPPSLDLDRTSAVLSRKVVKGRRRSSSLPAVLSPPNSPFDEEATDTILSILGYSDLAPPRAAPPPGPLSMQQVLVDLRVSRRERNGGSTRTQGVEVRNEMVGDWLLAVGTGSKGRTPSIWSAVTDSTDLFNDLPRTTLFDVFDLEREDPLARPDSTTIPCQVVAFSPTRPPATVSAPSTSVEHLAVRLAPPAVVIEPLAIRPRARPPPPLAALRVPSLLVPPNPVPSPAPSSAPSATWTDLAAFPFPPASVSAPAPSSADLLSPSSLAPPRPAWARSSADPRATVSSTSQLSAFTLSSAADDHLFFHRPDPDLSRRRSRLRGPRAPYSSDASAPQSSALHRPARSSPLAVKATSDFTGRAKAMHVRGDSLRAMASSSESDELATTTALAAEEAQEAEGELAP
ncbi:hypothetical protein JCM1840_000115 [Sporobolomyces johnsonii]